MAEETQAPPRDKVVRLRDWVTLLLSLVTVVGFFAHVLLRQMYAGFLAHLNIRPEELGLSYFTVLTSSMGAIAFGLGLPVMVTFTIWSVIKDARATRAAVLAAAAALGTAITLAPVQWIRLIGACALVIVAGFAVANARSRKPSKPLLQLLVLLEAILLIIGLTATLLELGDLTGRSARFGLIPPRFTVLGMDVIGIRPTAVDIEWVDKGRHPDLPRCPMYVGQHEGTLFVFDVLAGESWRLPASATVITLDERPEGQALDRCITRQVEADLLDIDDPDLSRCLRSRVERAYASARSRRYRWLRSEKDPAGLPDRQRRPPALVPDDGALRQ